MERLILTVLVAFYTFCFDRVDGELHSDAEVTVQQEPAGGLRALAARSGLLVGAAVMSDPLRNDEAYRKVLAAEYSLLTPEIALKFANVHPEPDRYNFGDFDQILSFAELNEMCVRGHTLVWHRQLPTWLYKRHWARDDLINILRTHIYDVVGRYRGRVQYWDVVNEAISKFWGLRRTFWLRTLGPEYIEMAFRFAHEADPEARLFYNDYGVEGLGGKSERMYELVSGLLERGVPIHGVGLQAHVNVAIPAPEELKANFSRLERLGLEIHLTEVDVGVPQPATQDRLWKQAILYQRLMDACLGVRSCSAFVTWGFTDAHSWVPGYFPGLGGALPFDTELRPKPSYEALVGSLKATPSSRASGLTRRCS